MEIAEEDTAAVDLHQTPDAELVHLSRTNHPDAFSELMNRYQALGFALAMQCTHQCETAQDIVQESLLQAYLSLDRLRDTDRFKSWFYGIVVNVCRSWRRTQTVSVLSLEALSAYWAIPSPFNLEEEVEAQEQQRLIYAALQTLSPKNRLTMQRYYFHDDSIQTIAQSLAISPAAVKGRLHKGRQQLYHYVSQIVPSLVPVGLPPTRSIQMTRVALVRVIPHELRTLVLLLDASRQRILPLWLRHFDVAALQQPPTGQSLQIAPIPLGMDGPTADFISQLLQTGGLTIPTIHIESLHDQVLYATIRVKGPQDEHSVKARVEQAMILARHMGSDITIDDGVLTQLSLPLPPGEVEQQMDLVVQRLQANVPAPQSAPRIREPQNLGFTEGLSRWEMRGSFMHESSPTQWPDYMCGTEPSGRPLGEMCGYIHARIEVPAGFADLRQAILVDDLRGKQVQFSADLKTQDVAQHAGLYLRVVDPGRTKGPEEREQTTTQGTQGWTRYATQIDVPADAVFLLFGVSLTGTGRICVANVQVKTMG